MATLGELVAAGRRRQRLSREDLGALLRRPDKPQGLWSTYIGQVERGTRVPPDSTVLQLAEVLGIDARRLLAAAYASRARTPLR